MNLKECEVFSVKREPLNVNKKREGVRGSLKKLEEDRGMRGVKREFLLYRSRASLDACGKCRSA